MKNLIRNICFALIVGASLASCGSRDKIVYVQGAEFKGELPVDHPYSMHIKPGDELTIIVNSANPELAAPFNMELDRRAFGGTHLTGTGQASIGTSGSSPQVFIVDPEGQINYPTIGKLKVEGMTRDSLSSYLEHYLRDNGHVTDAIVKVTFYNTFFTVLGEVNHPGQFPITRDRVTIFEAIALAGDLTVYGERNRVFIYREEVKVEGTGANRQRTTVTKVYPLDLKDPNTFSDDNYYIQQYDVIYVEPNATKASNREISSLYTFALSLVSMSLTIATFIRSFQ